MTDDSFLDRIIEWATEQNPIRALLLEGSLAEPGDHDSLSDYDINAFVTSHEPYTSDDEWMSELAPVAVYVPAKGTHNGEPYPTRLIIFKDGAKVDFSFLTLDVLEDFSKQLPDHYDTGYKVLLDKDGLTSGLAKPAFKAYRSGKPAQEEFYTCIREFWFEAYHVAKSLSRNDLWVAKFRDWSTKEHLIQMIEWHSRARHKWDYRTHPLGKRMRSWTDPWTWKELQHCFGHFEAEDSWKALLTSCRLFSVTARETAKILGCNYPVGIEEDIVFIANRLRQGAREQKQTEDDEAGDSES